MAAKNSGIKTLLIVVNVLIWGFVISRLWPLFFGDGTETTSPARSAVRRVDPVSSGRRAPRVVRPGLDAPPSSDTNSPPWMAKDLVAFFERINDPFRPVLEQGRPSSGVAVVRRPKQRVDFRPPRGEDVKKQPVVTLYRLSSIVRIGENTLALLTTGVGANTQTVSVKQGMRLPGGEFIREIDFKNKHVILVKEGHVFKLVDFAPWVMLLSRPQ